MTKHIPTVSMKSSEVLLIGDKGSTQLLKTNELNKLTVKAGEKYRILKKTGEQEQLLDDVVAVNSNGNLELQYADGTRVSLEGFYQTQGVTLELPANSGGTHTIASLDGMGQEGSLSYAHGDHSSLMGMTQNNTMLQAAISEKTALMDLPHYAELATEVTGIATDATVAATSTGATVAASTGGLMGLSSATLAGLGAVTVGSVAVAVSSGGGSTPFVSADTTASVVLAIAISDSGTSASDNITNVNTITVSNIEAGATWQYSLNAGTTWSAAQAATTTSFNMTADTAYEIGAIKVRQTDAEGNVSAVTSSTVAITEDSIASAAPTINVVSIDDLINAAESTAGFNLTGTGVAGSTVTVTGFETDIAAKTALVANNGTWSIAIVDADLADNGANTLSATQTDVAGNTSIAGTRAITVDTMAPASPILLNLLAASDSGISSTDNLTNVTTPIIGVAFNNSATDGSAAVAGDTVVLRVGNVEMGSAVLSATDVTNGYVNISVSGLSEGGNSFTATVVDQTGNAVTLKVTSDAAAATAATALTLANATNAVTLKVTSDADAATAASALTLANATNAVSLKVTSDADAAIAASALTLANATNAVTLKVTSDAAAATATTSLAATNVALADDAALVTADVAAATSLAATNAALADDAALVTADVAAATSLAATNAALADDAALVTADVAAATSLAATNAAVAGNVSAASAALAITLDKVGAEINDYLFVDNNTFTLYTSEIIASTTFNASTTNLRIGTGNTLSTAFDGTFSAVDNTFTIDTGSNPFTTSNYILIDNIDNPTFTDIAGNSASIFEGKTGIAIGNTLTSSIDLGTQFASYEISNYLSTVNSTLIGGAGSDTITGGSGNDIITGGKGADNMNGGAGNNTFVFAQGDSTVTAWTDINVIGTVDAGDTFTFSGGVDLINLSGLSGTTTMTLSNATLQTAEEAVQDDKYTLTEGVFNGGVFTVGTGTDTLVVYDGTTGTLVSQTAFVLTNLTSILDTTAQNTISYTVL